MPAGRRTIRDLSDFLDRVLGQNRWPITFRHHCAVSTTLARTELAPPAQGATADHGPHIRRAPVRPICRHAGLVQQAGERWGVEPMVARPQMLGQCMLPQPIRRRVSTSAAQQCREDTCLLWGNGLRCSDHAHEFGSIITFHGPPHPHGIPPPSAGGRNPSAVEIGSDSVQAVALEHASRHLAHDLRLFSNNLPFLIESVPERAVGQARVRIPPTGGLQPLGFHFTLVRGNCGEQSGEEPTRSRRQVDLPRHHEHNRHRHVMRLDGIQHTFNV